MTVGLYRQPDVSDSEIVFVSREALWIVPKDGGQARQLSIPEVEGATVTFPRFSPDGSSIAFTSTREGSEDLWILDRASGKASRLTTHPADDRMLDWFPSGDALLFSSNRESVFPSQYHQLYKLSFDRSEDGFSRRAVEKLGLPYGEFGAVSPDGQYLTFQPMATDFQWWNRYRGGMAPDLYRCRLLRHGSVDQITRIVGRQSSDSHPMWSDAESLIFLSDWYQRDQEPVPRANLYAIQLSGAQRVGKWTRLTTSHSFDIRFPAIHRSADGSAEIVFEVHGEIRSMTVRGTRVVQEGQPVAITLPPDAFHLAPRTRKVSSRRLRHPTLSNGGGQIVFEAFGDLWRVDRDGRWTALVQEPGEAARYPSITADGRLLAYHSDGNPRQEYQLVIRELESDKKWTYDFDDGFRYPPVWSPDKRFLAFVDNRHEIWLLGRRDGRRARIGRAEGTEHSSLEKFALVWTRDSRYLIYSSATENRNGALFLHVVDPGSGSAGGPGNTYQLTSGDFNDSKPCLSVSGDRLYFISRRRFNIILGEVGYSWIYANTEGVYYLSFDLIEASLAAWGAPAGGAPISLYPKLDPAVEAANVPAGRIYRLGAVDGGLLVYRRSNQGASDFQEWIDFYDSDKNRMASQPVAENVKGFYLAPDHEMMLVRRVVAGITRYHLVEASAQPVGLDDPIRVSGLVQQVDPREEWPQLFREAWRLVRDYFYVDKAAERDWLVNWENELERHRPLLDKARTRREVNQVIGAMYGQLASSHTGITGGDRAADPGSANAWFLGADLRWRRDKLVIERILHGFRSEHRYRPPLAFPKRGAAAEKGDEILTVQGRAPSPGRPIWNYLVGLAEVEVRIRRARDGSEETLFVQPVSWKEQQRLRLLAWIADHLKRVDRFSGGLVGYVALPETTALGQAFFTRQYQSQFHKEGLILDARFCSGGRFPDDIIELVARPKTARYPSRFTDFSDESELSRTGVQVMLINAWSGSAGDLLPYLFRRLRLGKVIGTRSWGGVVSSQGVPDLVDGGKPKVPNQAFVDPLEKVKIENRGYSPSRRVDEDFAALAEGRDVQLDAALQSVLADLLGPKNGDAARRSTIDVLSRALGGLDPEDASQMRTLLAGCPPWAYRSHRTEVGRSVQAILKGSQPSSSKNGKRASSGRPRSAASMARASSPLNKSWR